MILAALGAVACSSTPPPGGSAPATGPAAPPAAAAPRDPTSLRYAAGVSRYKVETSFHSVTEIMGNTQVADGSVIQWVSVTLAPQGENTSANYTIDSVTLAGQAPQGMGDPSALRGQVFRAVLAPNGRNVSIAPPDTANPMFVTAAEGLREFFPSLPPAPISVGQTWTDTVSATNRQPGTTIRTRSVRNHRVIGWETQGGQRVLSVASASAISLDGEGDAQGQAIQLTGTGTGTMSRFVSANGTYLSQTAGDSTNITVTVLSMGLEVPVRQTRRAVITRLP